jgi:DNA polymerase III subunit epsilon
MLMFFDTETTGLPDFKAPSDAPQQPRLVQLAMISVDPETRERMGRSNMIVRPDGWTIPDETAALHGITTERAMDEGMNFADVMEEFHSFLALSNHQLAYGLPFDQRIMRIAMFREGKSRVEIEAREKMPGTCIMRLATPLCKIPPTAAMMATGRKTFKNPKLAEAMKILMDEELIGAHDAMADIEGAMRLYWHIQDLTKDTARE